ncbi:general secretion pathway protein G [Clostridium sp. CAG:715]|nr:general secretion pathway protein G [Clostridium sp. CAG:715]
MKKESKIAFTLAEVLITLGIIGVVAAMTIPSLIQSYKEKATVTAVKQSYSIFAQALKMVTIDNPDLSALTDSSLSAKENSQIMFNEISKHIKKVKSCDVDKKCMGNTYYLNLNNEKVSNWDTYNNLVTGVLANGTSFWILSLPASISGEETYAGQIGIDINGNKRPNKFGVDFFWFTFNKNGELFAGRGEGTGGIYGNCELSPSNSNWSNGYGCSEWIITHGNMDYLKRNIRKNPSE